VAVTFRAGSPERTRMPIIVGGSTVFRSIQSTRRRQFVCRLAHDSPDRLLSRRGGFVAFGGRLVPQCGVVVASVGSPVSLIRGIVTSVRGLVALRTTSATLVVNHQQAPMCGRSSSCIV
jgi:hypothetical protein